jgi:hypothetical protein
MPLVLNSTPEQILYSCYTVTPIIYGVYELLQNWQTQNPALLGTPYALNLFAFYINELQNIVSLQYRYNQSTIYDSTMGGILKYTRYN